ncbi:MAG: zf-HC2 domain-containing protein [Oscillospiraceae bacterium]|nr:zf-HC2 domain-containing protein [Oscillospiraceae bacterium]
MNNNIDCAIIRDLLPLYADNVLSEESRAAVSEHIKTCEHCERELIQMQTEIKKTTQDNKAKIDILKAIKKKFFWKNILIAVISFIITVAVAIGGFNLFISHTAFIEYEDGLIWVETVNTESLTADGLTTTVKALDVICDKNIWGSYSASRIIDNDDKKTMVTYICCTETLLTKLSPKHKKEDKQFIRLVAEVEGIPSLEREIYYLIASFDGFEEMSDDEFYTQRNNGVLLFKGG